MPCPGGLRRASLAHGRVTRDAASKEDNDTMCPVRRGMPDALEVLAGSAPAVFGYLIHLGFLALVGLLQRQAKKVPAWTLGPKDKVLVVQILPSPVAR